MCKNRKEARNQASLHNTFAPRCAGASPFFFTSSARVTSCASSAPRNIFSRASFFSRCFLKTLVFVVACNWADRSIVASFQGVVLRYFGGFMGLHADK